MAVQNVTFTITLEQILVSRGQIAERYVSEPKEVRLPPIWR